MHGTRQALKDAPIRRAPTPTALRVGPADDAHEREADRAAEAVAGGGLAPWINALPGDGSVRRRCDACAREDEAGTLRRDAAGSDAGGGSAPPIVGEVLQSAGRPLDAGLRAEMERGFGHDFSTVRVHDDARAAESARAVSAHAYTVGSDVVFAAGRYAPASGEGRRLVAHELAHVVQQDGTAARGSVATPRALSRRVQRQLSEPEVRRRIAQIETEVASSSLPPDRLAALERERARLTSELSAGVSSAAPSHATAPSTPPRTSATGPLVSGALSAPGDCTPADHAVLQAEVDRACDRDRRCRTTDDCATLLQRVDANAECIRARVRINARCFRGGDIGHNVAVAYAVNALANCYAIYDRQCRPREVPVPVPVPVEERFRAPVVSRM